MTEQIVAGIVGGFVAIPTYLLIRRYLDRKMP